MMAASIGACLALALLARAAAADTNGSSLAVTVEMSPHAWIWTAASDPLHDARFCIDPPPFGKQCTMHAGDAVRSCAHIGGCVGVVCPDPTPYERGQPRRRIAGPICQARGHKQDERNHLMCRPAGCARLAVDRGGSGPVAAVALPPADALPPFLRTALAPLRANGTVGLAADAHAAAAAAPRPRDPRVPRPPSRGARRGPYRSAPAPGATRGLPPRNRRPNRRGSAYPR